MSATPILWYFADPMCSWCWGFSPVIEQIRVTYGERLNIALMMGGLRAGTGEPMSATMRNEILHHWSDVHSLTAQPFTVEGAMPEGFIYDTEPASRAVISLAELMPDKTFPYFKSIQSAFYVDKVDVSQPDKLAELASKQDVDTEQFLLLFHSEKAKQKTLQHFQATQQAGVRGFPSLVLQQDTRFEFIARGYTTVENLVPNIESWLAN